MISRNIKMWNLLVVLFLVAKISVKCELQKESSIYDGHHFNHGGPPLSFSNNNHFNSVGVSGPGNPGSTTGGGYLRQSQPPITYTQQQPYPVNIGQQQSQQYPPENFQSQQPISSRQVDPNVNFTSVQGHPGGYFPPTGPHGGFHHPPEFYPNGGVAYRTGPPIPIPHGIPFGHGHTGYNNVSPGSGSGAGPTTAPAPGTERPPSRNSVTETPPPRNLKKTNSRKTTKKTSQTLPKRKSQKNKEKQVKTKSQDDENDDIHSRFNFSYIPSEFIDKGFPIQPTLEIVRNDQGIPIVIPVFRPLPISNQNGTAYRQQNKKNQRQQGNQGQNLQQPYSQQFYQNGPGFAFNQGPFTIQMPFSQQQQQPLLNSNGFVTRNQPQILNITGHGPGPSLGLNYPWPHPISIGPYHQGHLPVPYPISNFGWGPEVFFNTTNGIPTPGPGAGGEAAGAPAPETPARKAQSPKPSGKPAKDTKSKKTKTKEKVPEDEEEDEETEEEDQEENEATAEAEQKKRLEELVKSIRKQAQAINDAQKEEEDSENEVEDDEDDDSKDEEEAKPVSGADADEEDEKDTEEVNEEIPQTVLKEMIREYNEKNKDTPITSDEQQAQEVVDRLRTQIEGLLNVFAVRNQNIIPPGRNHTADHIEWNRQLRERYQLRSRPTRGPSINTI